MKKQKIKIKVILWYFVHKSLFQWFELLLITNVTTPIRFITAFQMICCDNDEGANPIGVDITDDSIITVYGSSGYTGARCLLLCI